MKTFMAIAVLGLASSLAIADTKVTVRPASARPGDAVLVTVTGSKVFPKGDVGGKQLQFKKARAGYQAVFAVPLDAKDKEISVEVDDAKVPARVAVRTVTFPEASVVVEEELANPAAAERTRIDADNQAILTALAKGDGDPQFTAEFQRPRGATTSGFGEWRTFNDGHRSQHLGLDFAAKVGARVNAINGGTVTLVRDTFLAGRVVVVAHGSGVASAYFHLSDIAVAEGDLVGRGQAIGKAGQTGRATGPHLHLALRVTGGLVDPASFFKLRFGR